VGKTTVAVNLALALGRLGLDVGLLDGDVLVPSLPLVLGVRQEPEVRDGVMAPVEKFGLKLMSMGFLTGEGQPIPWCGPMVGKTVGEFVGKVRWGPLDYLVVDLPPGTGDASVALLKSVPTLAVLAVTTPQAAAVAGVRRALAMFQRRGSRVVGLVENMSRLRCGASGESVEPFGAGGGSRLSAESGVPLLASLPMDLELRRGGDAGVPLMVAAPDSPMGSLFAALGEAVRACCEGPRALH
jgi:ATP-binding protein involved in chromosome partitioning